MKGGCEHLTAGATSLPEGSIAYDDETIVESDCHLVRLPVQHHAPRAFKRVVECVLQAVCIRMQDLDSPLSELETMVGNVG